MKTYAANNIAYVKSKIYTLSDTSGNVFYVGCTTQPIEARLTAHIKEAQAYPNRPKSIKIAALNFDVVATIIDVVTETRRPFEAYSKKGVEREREWIKKYLAMGCTLTNVRVPNLDKKEAVNEVVGAKVSAKDLQFSLLGHRA